MRIRYVFAWSLLVFSLANRPGLGWTETPQGADSTSTVAVGPQYDTTHVYVSPENVDAFLRAFLGTFGGTSTKQVVVTVTPTPSYRVVARPAGESKIPACPMAVGV